MNINELNRICQSGETTKIQFKERINDKTAIASELVAFSNSKGGLLLVGINDKTGGINPLSYDEVQETSALLSNLASSSVLPNILIDIEIVKVEGGSVVVANIKEGQNKPYRDNKGIIWVKNGADKRKVFDNAELAEMMSSGMSFSPDESAVNDATIDDLDAATIKLYLSNRFSNVLSKKLYVGDKLNEASLDEVCAAIISGHNTAKLLKNLRFIRPDGKITMAAMLLFGKYTQRWLPVMTAKCICFVGNSVSGSVFRDKVNDSDIEGNLLHQFNTIMSFLERNLRNVQVGSEFNSNGVLELPYVCLVELIVNALVHRSLSWNAPIRVFIFDDRVEIHSPGSLPNGLTVQNIIEGTSIPRNNFLFNNAIHLLPYTGAGSGIQRAIETGVKINFVDNADLHEFTTILPRISNQQSNHQSNHQSNQVSNHQSNHQSNQQSNHQSNQQSNHQSNHQSNQESNHQSNQVSNHQSNQQSNQESNHQNTALTKEQRDIRNYCRIPRTSQEILARIGVSNQSKNRQKHILSLIELGVLEMTIPENPKDKNQKYRAVRKKK